ncbi:copper transport repressor, CopY/TcrY family [Evansella caseinilytica]|uniref:Copper transport repressor, CopY/TcrY family n=1 Tax=Evansella caseinilytica TaxID=1503961 RepID=A0A1H3MTP8_9BACI|nr:CopY/TcrY family copper transport repressor [Evansella caseinilytica]SDY79830.1 copper transport repressor, CopY/TcrY family [Evansella caseinilytica]
MSTELDAKITDAEWEIMRVVWTQKKVTSKEIIDILHDKKNWKPATTKTFIGRLVKKGMLHTEADGKRYFYSAIANEEETIQSMVDGFFDHICSKAVGKTIADMISSATLSFDDVALLEEALENKKKEAVDEVKCNCVPGQCQCKTHHCKKHH